jgi:probable F420-dependent oxidoreductase
VKVDLAAGSPGPASVARVAGAAEAIGLDAIWLAETEHEPFVLCALALAATHRITVGTGIAVAFARSPIVLAQAAVDLAALSGGRFHLGLGTQVRAHVERRFGMPWSAPAPRLAEWIGAIRAAWATWQDGAPFRMRSEHLDLSLMPPFFSPPPLAFEPRDGGPRIPISVAGVGPGLARLAGRVADGFQVHPFHTARYLAEVLRPALAQGVAERGPGAHVELIVPVFLAPTDDPARLEEVRARIAFYASTPSYRPVLALHGRAAVGERLGRLAATGRWAEMPPLIDDELLALVAVVGPADALPDLLAARVAGQADRVLPMLPFEPGPDGELPNAAAWERAMRTLRSPHAVRPPATP